MLKFKMHNSLFINVLASKSTTSLSNHACPVNSNFGSKLAYQLNFQIIKQKKN